MEKLTAASIDDEKDRLTLELSERYARDELSLEEYGRILDYVNKLETPAELRIAEKIIRETVPKTGGAPPVPYDGGEHLALFSWRTTTVVSSGGHGGVFTSLFGANRIVIDSLPAGRTVLEVKSIFGLTEIIVPENVKIVNRAAPVFGGIFAPAGSGVSADPDRHGGEPPELLITGAAVFGNITIRRKG